MFETSHFSFDELCQGKRTSINNGKRVYHRKGGALRFHGRDHSHYTPSLDRKRKAKTILKGKRRKHYPHTEDAKGKRL